MAAKEVSQNKKNLIKFVSDKIHKKNEKVEAVGKDLGAKSDVLNDYVLVFTGALDALDALGVSEEDALPVNLALDSIDSELATLDKSIQLEKMLNGE